MLKFLTWFLSLSSLFALSRPGNGALLPPPGARSAPILKRDGAQPVRRQDCAAPGLEVDQDQVTHSPSNPYNSKFANGWPVWKKLFTDICNTNPQNDFVTCYNTLLAMAQESANGYCAQQYEVYNACLVLNDYDTITCGESRLRFLNCSKATLEAFAICTCYYQQPSPLYSCANVILQTRPKSLGIEIPTATEIDTSLLLTAPIVPSTTIASLPTGSSSGVTPSSGTDLPTGAGILPRDPLVLPGLPGLPNLTLPIPIFPALPVGTPNVPTLPVRPPLAIVPTVPVPLVPVLTNPAVPTVPVPPTSPAIPVTGVPILPIIPIRPAVPVVPSIPGILPATIPGFPSIPIATPGLPAIPGLPVAPSFPVPSTTILGLPSSTPGQPILPTTIPNGPGTTIGFPNPPTIPTTTPCTTFSRFETITATFRQVLLPFYTITYTSAVTSTILSVENTGRETGIGVGVCGGSVTSTIY